MKLRELLAPPKVGDDSLVLAARMLHIIVYSLLLAAAGISVVLAATGQYQALRVMGVSVALGLVTLWLARRGALELASLWMLTLMLAATTYVLTLGGGLHDIALLIYPVSIIIAGLLLSRRLFLLMVAMAIAMMSGVAYLQMAGIVITLKPAHKIPGDLMVGILILGVTALGVYLLADTMRQNLQAARRELAERRQAEEQYRLISSVISDYTFTTRVLPDGTLEAVSLAGAFEAITGYSPEEFKATGGWRAHLHPADVAQDERDLAQLHANKRVVTEVRTIRKGGELRWVRVYAHPVWDEANHRLTGVYGAVQDITERRLAEDGLRDAEMRYRTLVEQTSVVIYRDAPDALATAIYISPQIESLVGYTQAEWLSNPHLWHTLLHPDDYDRMLKEVSAYLDSEGPFASQYRLQARDGRWVWVQDEAVMVRDSAGRPLYVHGVLSDISGLMEAESALRRTAERLELLHDIDRAILAAHSPGEIAAVALDRIRAAIPCHFAAVFLFDFATDECELVAVHKAGETRVSNARSPMIDFDLTDTLRARNVHVVNDLAAVAAPSSVEARILAEGVRAYIDSPLIVRGWLVGSLSLESPEPNVYDQERIEFIGEVANQLAIAIEQSRLMNATAVALAREQRLNEVARIISESLDLPTTLSNIVRLAAELVGADAGMMGMVSADDQTLNHPYLYNLPAHLKLDQPAPRAEGLSWRALEQGQTMRLSDYQAYEAALPHWLAAGIHAVIDVPVIAAEERLGVLGLYHFDAGKRFSDRDVALAEAVARQAAVAIQNARLFEAERQRTATLSALHEVGLHLSTQLDLRALLRTIMEQAARLLDAPMGGLYLMRPDGLVLEPVANLPAGDTSSPVTLGEGLVGRVAAKGGPVVVDDYATWPGRLRSINDPNFRAVIAVPITWNDRPLGVLSVCDPRPGRFRAHHVDIVQLFTAQAAIAIQNARLFQAEQQRVALFTVLHETGLNISAQLELPELLQIIVERAAQLLRASMGSLFLRTGDSEVLDMVVRYNVPDSGFRQPFGTLKFGEGLAGRVAESGQALIIDDYAAWPGRVLEATPYRSAIGVPIKWQGQVMGAISVLDELPARFDPSQIEPVSLLAAQAAIAIQNARLFEATRRHVQDLTVLHAAASASTVAASEHQLLERVAEILKDAMPFDILGIAMYDEATGRLTGHPASRGLPDGRLDLMQTDLSRGVVGRVATTGKPMRIADVRQEIAYFPLHPDIRSELCVPVQTGTRLIGVIDVESRRFNAYGEADERLLVTLAGQIATAIERLRTDTQLRQLNVELEHRVAERTAQLEMANRELESFSYSVSHDLRAPLRSINGFSRILVEKHAAHLDAGGREYLERISDAASRMAQMLGSLLDFSSLSRQPIRKTKVDLLGLTHEALYDLQINSPERRIETQVADLPPAQADPALMRQVLENLLGNALKYSSGRAEARIEVGFEQAADGRVVYFVRDNGVGFDMAYAGKIFGVFQRLHTQTEFEGTGIGLASVKRIIDRHGGRVWAEAELDKGATFYFTLES